MSPIARKKNAVSGVAARRKNRVAQSRLAEGDDLQGHPVLEWPQRLHHHRAGGGVKGLPVEILEVLADRGLEFETGLLGGDRDARC